MNKLKWLVMSELTESPTLKAMVIHKNEMLEMNAVVSRYSCLVSNVQPFHVQLLQNGEELQSVVTPILQYVCFKPAYCASTRK